MSRYDDDDDDDIFKAAKILNETRTFASGYGNYIEEPEPEEESEYEEEEPEEEPEPEEEEPEDEEVFQTYAQFIEKANFEILRKECPSLNNIIGTCWLNAIIQFCNSISESNDIEFQYILKQGAVTLDNLAHIVRNYCPARYEDNDYDSKKKYSELQGGTWDHMSDIIFKIAMEINDVYKETGPIVDYIDTRSLNNKNLTTPIQSLSGKDYFRHTPYVSREKSDKKYIILANSLEINKISKIYKKYDIEALIVLYVKDRDSHALCIKKCLGQYYILDDAHIEKLEIPIKDILKDVRNLTYRRFGGASSLVPKTVQYVLYKKIQS